MTFSNSDKLKAMAIARVFETSKPTGDFAAWAVLDDGAGVSYGINQFTHKSGSLLAVAEAYLENGGQVGRAVIEENLPLLRKRTTSAIRTLAAKQAFKKALQSAAITREMRLAQSAVAFERYLRPAIEICEVSGFVLPLSLAVVYDSITHGSWERIRDRVGDGANRSKLPSLIGGVAEGRGGGTRNREEPIRNPFNHPGRETRPPLLIKKGGLVVEKAWITEYVRTRHAWLESIPRLRKTSYRTNFFLTQIARGNWTLELPLDVHGVRFTKELFTTSDERDSRASQQDSPVEPADSTQSSPIQALPKPPHTDRPQAVPAERAQPANIPDDESCLDRIERRVNDAVSKYDRVEAIVNTIIARRDAAKSLWTTIVGTVWQVVWALTGFVAGIPREIWFVVAVIAGILMIAYLYRQIALGKIREKERSTRVAELRSFGV